MPPIPDRTPLLSQPSHEAVTQPDYVNFPIDWQDIEVSFSSEEFQEIWQHRGMLGDSDEEVVRTLFLHWYLENRKKHGLRWYTPRQSHA